MQYKTLYVTDDGTQFENKFDAMDYCTWQKIKVLSTRVIFYDRHFNKLPFVRAELGHDGFYGKVWFVDVHAKDEVRALHELSEYTGWCGFSDIDGVGMWKWNEEKKVFEK